jgi:hypothetical protein
VFKDASTTDERIPIIAMTTRSSMSVKPRLVVVFIVIGFFF